MIYIKKKLYSVNINKTLLIQDYINHNLSATDIENIISIRNGMKSISSYKQSNQ